MAVIIKVYLVEPTSISAYDNGGTDGSAEPLIYSEKRVFLAEAPFTVFSYASTDIRS
jgi:hypothetical protein